MELAEGLEDAGLVREVEVGVLGEKAHENQLMRCAAAKPDVGALVLDDLVGRAVEFGRQARVAERGQRIGGDDDLSFLRTATRVVMASESGRRGTV
jgi:hypothetical protein